MSDAITGFSHEIFGFSDLYSFTDRSEINGLMIQYIYITTEPKNYTNEVVRKPTYLAPFVPEAGAVQPTHWSSGWEQQG